MIDNVATICIFVDDQDRAKEFYTSKLGFEVRGDFPMGDSSRWLAVAPKGAQTEIILYKMDGNWDHYHAIMGKSQAMTFHVTDIDALHTTLKERGVQIVSAPDKQPWGTFMTILDQDENALLMVEN